VPFGRKEGERERDMHDSRGRKRQRRETQGDGGVQGGEWRELERWREISVEGDGNGRCRPLRLDIAYRWQLPYTGNPRIIRRRQLWRSTFFVAD